MKKGKQERYIKDDPGLTEYLVTLALENASLYVNENAPPIGGLELEKLAKQHFNVRDIIEHLTRKIPLDLLDQLVHHEAVTVEKCANKDFTEQWVNKYVETLTNAETDGATYTASIHEDHERQIFVPKVTIRQHGIDNDYVLGHDFITSTDYEKIVAFGEATSTLIEEGGYMLRGEKKKPLKNFTEMIEWLMSESKRGLYIQRYKGLGEMNPEQLWETTMDPEARRMLQVTIEDAIGADQLFTCLMGDQVEPRRDFIETNALKVANLDV